MVTDVREHLQKPCGIEKAAVSGHLRQAVKMERAVGMIFLKPGKMIVPGMIRVI